MNQLWREPLSEDTLVVLITLGILVLFWAIKTLTLHSYAFYRKRSWERILQLDEIRKYDFSELITPEKKTIDLLKLEARKANDPSEYPDDLIGCGTSGNVYLRHDMTNNANFVAVKMFHCTDTENIHFALQEIRAHQQSQGPYIVRTLGYSYELSKDFSKVDRLALVLEFCSMGNLEEFITVDGEQITEDLLLKWVSQLAMAVDHLHKIGCINADIKSANVMITESKDIRLGDFGSAVEIEDMDNVVNGFFGTPEYDPPEIVNQECEPDQLQFDRKVDIWGLGCVMFESMTRKLLNRVAAEIPLREIEQSIPTEYSRRAKRILLMLLEQDPVKRSNAEDIVAQLMKINQRPVQKNENLPEKDINVGTISINRAEISPIVEARDEYPKKRYALRSRQNSIDEHHPRPVPKRNNFTMSPIESKVHSEGENGHFNVQPKVLPIDEQTVLKNKDQNALGSMEEYFALTDSKVDLMDIDTTKRKASGESLRPRRVKKKRG